MTGSSAHGVERPPAPLKAIWRVVSASRIHKLVPLLLLVTNAGLLVGPGFSVSLHAVAVAVVLLGSMFGMQLNVLTDRNLDRATKPHLLSWLISDAGVLRRIMWAEGVACVVLLALSATRSGLLALALGFYLLCFTLYSFNIFVPRRAVEARLKVFWWGNLATALGSYIALWVAGFEVGQLSGDFYLQWAAAAIALSLVDYGVFLNECAGDAASERAHGLRTLPALLGERSTSALAVAILILGIVLLTATLVGFESAFGRMQIVVLAWHAGVQATSVLLTLGVVRRGRSRWETLVDLSFWFSRVGALVLLLGWRLLAR